LQSVATFSMCGRGVQCAVACCTSQTSSSSVVQWQCGAVWRSVVQCGAVCCSVLHLANISPGAVVQLQCIAVCCSVLQCIAVCCSVLHLTKHQLRVGGLVSKCRKVLPCGAVWCHVLQCVAPRRHQLNVEGPVAVRCNVLQYVVLCCSVLHLANIS